MLDLSGSVILQVLSFSGISADTLYEEGGRKVRLRNRLELTKDVYKVVSELVSKLNIDNIEHKSCV